MRSGPCRRRDWPAAIKLEGQKVAFQLKVLCRQIIIVHTGGRATLHRPLLERCKIGMATRRLRSAAISLTRNLNERECAYLDFDD